VSLAVRSQVMTQTIVLAVEDLKMGGAQRSVISLSKSFVEAGHCVEVWIFDRAESYSGVLDPRVRLISLEDPRKKYGPLLSPLQLRKKLKSRKDEALVVLCFLPHIAFYLRWASLGFSWQVVDCERMHPAYEFTSQSFFQKIGMQLTYPLFSAITVQTESAKSFFPQFIANRVFVIENSTFPLPEKSEVSIALFSPYILFVGRMTAQKRVERVLKIFDEVKQKNSSPLNLVLVGDGPIKEGLLRFSKTLKSRLQIHFLGEKKTSKELYANAELLVLTSDFEGFPNVIIEAMSNACPVASTNCPSGPSEIITSGVNGYLAKNREGTDMIDFIVRTTKETQFKNELKTNALKSSERFQWKNVYPKWQQLFKSLKKSESSCVE